MSIEDLSLRSIFEVSALRLRDLIKRGERGAKTPAASPEESEKRDAPREEIPRKAEEK